MIGTLTRGTEFAATLGLVVEVCAVCSMPFAMTAEFQRDRLKRKRGDLTFYCPRGHGQHYTGETEEDRLKRELAVRTEQRDYAQRRRAAAETHQRHAEAVARGYKGHAAKLSKRIKTGKCPCCDASFADLQAHMAAQHPDFGQLTAVESATSQARLIATKADAGDSEEGAR